MLTKIECANARILKTKTAQVRCRVLPNHKNGEEEGLPRDAVHEDSVG